MLDCMPIHADVRQSKISRTLKGPFSGFNCTNPLLPPYVRSRCQRARAPKPMEYQGRFYDVMGFDILGKLLLRDQRAVHQDVRIEDFAGRLAMLDSECWRIISVKTVPGPTPLEVVPILELVDPDCPSRIRVASQADILRVRFPSRNGEHRVGRIKHGIMRLVSTVTKTTWRLRLQPGQQFESRLEHRELQGRFMVELGANGQLTATALDGDSQTKCITIKPADIAPRYRRVASLDFGGNFDVDAFLFREDQVRNQAANIESSSHKGPIQDPLFGILSTGGTMPELTSGAEHLAVFERFIRDHTWLSRTCDRTVQPRRLTILNLSMSNQGDARCVLDALIEFRRQNQTAQICIVVSKLGPTEFQESPEFGEYLDILARNRIDVNDYTNTDGQTRQVMHGKAIVIDDHVLFSTGAVMDTRPINKADISLELPRPAALAFRRYIDETIYNDATLERRTELAAELAALGVVINDPVASLTYVSRAQDALIRGARHSLIISLSELVDPTLTKMLIHRAASGVDVVIQVRELDRISAQLLANLMKQSANLRLEDSSWWEPRPHWNAIIADGTVAYVGSSYLWSTQRNMIHQGRSFENGVLLDSQATNRVHRLINELRSRNMAAMKFSISSLWNIQHKLFLRVELLYAENVFKSVILSFQILSMFHQRTTKDRKRDCLPVNLTHRWLKQ